MSTINISISKKVFNDIYLPYLEDYDSRYLVFYGGGSSGKSFFIAQKLVYELIHPTKCNILVVRQTGDSNGKSTFPLFKQVISLWNLGKYFKINESDKRIKCLVTNNEVAFAGLDDVEKIKSITFENGELTKIWIEEATECEEADVNQLKIRLRGGKSKKQMILSFNPINIQHWIKRHFVDGNVEKATVCHSTYKDNKFLSDDDRAALERFKYIDEYYYKVYCLGEWGIIGKTVFDARAISKRLDNLEREIWKGYFTYDYDGMRITNIKFVHDKSGYITIYEQPSEIKKYCIGGDTSGDGSDWFTGHVIEGKTGKQVACLKQQFDEDLYTKQMYCLGMYYKQALIGIEANFSSYPIRELERLGYKNQYVREAIDSYTGRTEKKFGFRTTNITRPTILANLVEIVREHTYLINDRDTLEELLTIVRNEKGRIEAPNGGHDDQMMGLAIAYEIRSQMVYNEEPITIAKEFREFDFIETNNKDYGERIVVV